MKVFEATVIFLLVTCRLYLVISQSNEHYADIVFLVDGSQHLTRAGFQQIRSFLIKTVHRLDIGMDKYRIGLAQYNGQAKTEFLLSKSQDKTTLLSYLRRNFQYLDGSALNTGRALDYLHKTFFTASAGSRKPEGVSQIAIVITSKRSEDDVTKAAAGLKNDGIKILSIGVKNSDQQELEAMAFLPNSRYVFQAKGFTLLNSLPKNIAEIIRTVLQPKIINGGSKDSQENKNKEEPSVCQSASVADIVFLVDESSSIGKRNFQLIRKFLYNLVNVLNVGPEQIHIGLVQYSTVTMPELYLNSLKSKPDILKQIQNIPYRGGGTYTGAAMAYLRQWYFNPRGGSRLNQGIPQIAVVVTDGKSQDKVTEAAVALRRSGVSVFAFGIENAVESELRKIASYPAESYVSILQHFDQLEHVEGQIQKKICNEILQQISMIPEQTQQLHQGCVETDEADIFFLIDGSGSISPENFQDLKRFLVDIMKVFSIGTDQVRVGVVQYADNPRVEVGSTQYAHKMELERVIRQIVQVGGGTNTGRALTYMKNFIGEAEKSRKTRVRRFLITVTDGKSQDDVTTPAVELQKQGVTVYAVGVGVANKNELQLIAGADERVFYTDNFDALTNMQNGIVRDICSKEACSKLDQADVIFLVDGSGSIAPTDFLLMKKFINVFLNKTNIGLDKVQIGLIQFSSNPKLEFQLGAHSTKAKARRAISDMQQLGGGTLTGQALSYTADYFDTARGGRPGIPQYLIVITDGEAQDEVLQPAKAMRDKGITVFAVGVFNANSTQLLEMGGSWDKVYYVENFELLEKIELQVSWEICSPPKDCWRTQVADIVFVIDGSRSLSVAQFNSMKSFMVGLVNNSDVAADKVQFGAVIYGDNIQTVFHLDQFTNKGAIQNAIYGMSPVGGATHTAKALSYAKGLLDPKVGGRKQFGVPQFLLLLTEGEATDKQQLNSAAEVIRNSDVNIYAVGVKNANTNELLQIAGSQENYLYAPEFQTLKPLIPIMSQKFCENSRPDCQVHEADIVFLIDGFRSISASDFKHVKDFLIYMAMMFNTGPTKFQFAVAQSSTHPVTTFNLNDTSNQRELVDRIERIQQLPPGNLMDALQYVMDLFQPAAGSRKLQGVPQYLLVITNSKSRDNVAVAANNLMKENVKVLAIGIGEANENELVQISGALKRKIYIEKFAELDQIKRRIVRNLCTPPEEEAAADVVFLVEGTQDSERFQRIQDIMLGIITQLNIGLHKSRIGFAQFDKNVKSEFLLNRYTDKKDVWSHIRKSYSFQGGGSLDIPGAINYLKTTQFIASAGSRKIEDVPQIAVIITKESSQAAVELHSQALIQEGVIVNSIAIPDILQPQPTAYRPMSPFIYQSRYLDHLYKYSEDMTILNVIKKAIKLSQPSVCLSASVADIVYLVDESSSIGEANFQLIRNFLINVISAMDVGPQKVQIGLIQYSTTVTPEFYFDTFQKKSDVLKHIRTMPYRMGGTHTGAAIDYMVRNYFTESRGCRINQGVPQIAVVVTDGKSSDDVKAPAAALRDLRVRVFAFGVKDAVQEELESIASYPANTYVSLIKDFNQLSNIGKEMQKKICIDIVNTVSPDPHEKQILEQGCVTEEADIFFLIDGSGSIYPQHFQELKKFLIDVVSCFSIGAEQVRVGVVQYSQDPQTEFTVTQHTSKTSLERAIEQIQQIGGGTNTGQALSYMNDFINESKGSRKTRVRRFLITVTDGNSDDDVRKPAAELSQQGVTVYGVGVGNVTESELEIIAGASERVFYTKNFDALQNMKKDIVQDICSKDGCGLKSDIIFLIDGSSSISRENFQKMLSFMKTFLDKSDIGPDKVQVGVIQFATEPELVFQLNKYSLKTELHRAMDNIIQKFGDTYIGRALSFTENYFDKATGGRPGIPQYLIVITDGEAHDKDFIKQPAKAIRGKGVIVFAVGVFGIKFGAQYSELLEISGSKDRTHYIENFDLLAEKEKKISWDMCKPAGDCKWTEEADILFVIDGSGSIQLDQFESMKTFMVALVNQTNIAPNKVRIGAMIFGDQPETKFKLDELQSKVEVREKIMQLDSVGGSTYTVEALKHARILLDGAHGGRKGAGVPQFLILITDGKATVTEGLNDTAAAIRDSNVLILAVGVHEAVEAELRMIAGSDENWFFVQDFTRLELLPQNLSKLICLETKPDCEIREADIVFLIDGSGSIDEKDFKHMKDFLKYIAKTLSMGPLKFRFALSQYSTKQVTEFYLNDTAVQNIFSDRIEKVTQLKGGTLTGKALHFVMDLFRQSAGSRKLERVPQFLLVITDGQSQDSVVGPANNLRQGDITVIAIGVGEANENELIQISGAPERKFYLSEFKHLDEVKRRVTRELCSEPAQACAIDVAVGFDSSNQLVFDNGILSGQYGLQAKLDGILKEMTSLTEVSCAANSQTEVRVGFYIQREDGHLIHETRFEKNVLNLVDDLKAIKMDSPVNLNANLLKSFLNKFSEPTPNIKVILLFTDGLDDDLDQLKQVSQMLRSNGVHALITVALEGASNVDEIPQIEFGTGFAYKEHLSVEMQAIGSALLKKIQSVAEKKCCNVNCVCTADRGTPGKTGDLGMAGIKGMPGISGHPGTDGEEGQRGPPGVTGPQGFMGCSGNRGRKGSRGYRGTQGSDGDHGIDGINGEQGEYGESGLAGEKGKPGYPGKKGAKGDFGDRGQLGISGDPGTHGVSTQVTGEKGEIGTPGQQGEMGTPGVGGSAGVPGNPGPEGLRGRLGTKGQTGSDGKPGRKGDVGTRGPQGDPGRPGSKGQRAGSGSRGQQGPNGVLGENGIDGDPGTKGHPGRPGDPGSKGVRGLAGPRGSPGMDGTSGFGSPGTKGRKGGQGSFGNTGLQGEPGKPGQHGKEGSKGARGQRGNAGAPGELGNPGDFGHPGSRGSRGPPGNTPMAHCELVSYIRENCPCCSNRRGECPAYPTELVFALDTSSDVTPAIFERMKRIVINLLQGMNIAESNCPTGARVAVLTYDNVARPFIRFSDFKKKTLLMKEIEELRHERSTSKRNIGRSMQFVASNTFKRVRNGVLVRKIAVFLTNGRSQDTEAIAVAATQFSALSIIPVILSFKDIPAMEHWIFENAAVVLPRQQQASQELLRRIQLCTLCIDECSPDDQCPTLALPPPIPVNLEIAFIIGDLQQMETEQSESVRYFLNSMVNEFVNSSEPKASDLHPRVALVQHTPNSTPRFGEGPFNLELEVLDYPAKTLKKRHIQDSFSQQEGPTGIGSTIEWSLKNFFANLTDQQIYKVIFTIFSGETVLDEKKLLEISREAKCNGFRMLALALGEVTNVTVLEEFVSFPFDQHLVHLDRALEAEMDYAQKFAVAFLKNLAKAINNYPPAALQKECGGRKSQGIGETRTSAKSERADIMQNTEGSKADISDICALAHEEGNCYNYRLKWYFDATARLCKMFWYGGCEGNKNSFDTRDECEALCLKSAI
ncbi:collagen alpha-6(VI) chain-like isoform X2 [Mustelus asterias]